jgi:hypothetical protein
VIPTALDVISSLCDAGNRIARTIDSAGFPPWRRYSVKCRLNASVRRMIESELHRATN